MLVAMTVCAVLLAFRPPGPFTAAGWFVLAVAVMWVLLTDWSIVHLNHGHTAMNAANYDSAIRFYSRAIKVTPEDPERYCYRGEAHYRRQDYPAAMVDFTTAISLDSHCLAAWLGRAGAAYRCGDYQQAVDDATIALCLAPENRSTLALRGSALLWSGRVEEALDDLSDLIAGDPEPADGYSLRAQAYQAAQRFEEALQDFNTALRLAPDSVRFKVGRAIARFKLGDFATAFREIEACVNWRPRSVEAFNTYAWFLATCPDDQLRNGQHALEQAQAAARLAGHPVWSCESSLAAAYAELGRFDEAIEHAELALQSAPPLRRADCEQRLAAYAAHRPYRDVCVSK